MVTAKSFASPQYCSAFDGPGNSAPCVSPLEILILCNSFFISSGTIRGEAIRVVRVVVVDIAARVDVPRIVRVGTIRTAQTDILGLAYIPIIYFSPLYRFRSESCHLLIPSRTSMVFLPQYFTRLDFRWNMRFAICISASSLLQYIIA